MAENDKKGFSGLGELAPKKKNRVKVETESSEPQIKTPKQAEKKSTRESTQTQRTKYSYPKDDPYALPSFNKITKNQWIVIGIVIWILWAVFSDDKSSSTSNSSNNSYSPPTAYSPPETQPYVPPEDLIPSTPVPDNSNNNFRRYSAIYWDNNSDVFGWAVGASSEEEAKSAAYEICKKRGAIGECEHQYSGNRRCVAIAKGLIYRAWSAGDVLKQTEDYAIKKCNEGPDACSIEDEGSRCS